MSRYTRVALLIGSAASIIWVGAHFLDLFFVIDNHIAAWLGFLTVPQQREMQWIAGAVGVLLAYGLAWTTIEISRPTWKLAVGLAALAEVVTGVWILSLYGYFLPPMAAILSGGSALSLGLAYCHSAAGANLAQLRHALGRRVSEKTLARILSSSNSPKLEGELREVSVLVCQWFGQDAAAGQLNAHEWVQVHNRLSRMVSNVVLPADGYLDQSNGECIRAIFGAPLADENHALAACGAAIDIIRELDALNESLVLEGRPPVDCRVGVSTGVTVTGVLGGESGRTFTVSGDAVMRAHRFCSANLIYGSRVLIGGRTVQLAESEIESRPLELIGGGPDDELDEVHELLNRRNQLTNEQALRRDAFWTGVILYRSNRLDEAVEQFTRARPNHGSVDLPVEFYLSRIEKLRTTPGRRGRPETVKRLNAL